MKEAIGTSMVFNLMMIFVGVMIVLLIGSIAYSKGFKVRNRIIDIIERNENYDTDTTKDEIAADLRNIGYRISSHDNCEHNGNIGEINEDYDYCIFEYTTTKGKYYGVQVYIHFDFPLIGDFLDIPVYGETKILFDKKGVNN